MVSTARGIDAITLPAAPRIARQADSWLSWIRVAPGRILRDRYTVYTASLAPIALLVALSSALPGDVPAVLVMTGVCGGLQVLLGLVPARARGLSTSGWSFLRMTVALLYVAGLSSVVGGPSQPLLVLYIPVLVAAAAMGTLPAAVFGSAAALIYLAPELAHLGNSSTAGIRGIALAGAGIATTVGVRRLVLAVERAARQLRSAMVTERRRSRQIAGLEAVSRFLMSEGSGPEVLEKVLGVLSAQFHYHFVTAYVSDGTRMQFAAQRGYHSPPPVLNAVGGIVARVISTKEIAFVPNVAADPDYVEVDSEVVSEICAPLMVDGTMLGVLNVEARTPLDASDRVVVATIADRIATLLALRHEREALTERAAVLRSLNEFNSVVSGELELDRLAAAITHGVGAVIASDIVALTVLDRDSGRYLLRSFTDASPAQLGREIVPGEGLAGRAIRDRTVVFDEAYTGESLPAAYRGEATEPLAMSGVGIPLVRGGVVVGAISIARRAPVAPFRPIEIEAIDLLAGQAALVIANAFLHAEVEELAIRDPLTGAYNRRHFDAALDRMLAGWRRAEPAARRPIAAIMFDLDRFGEFNKRHGHQTGDQVLKTFAGVLRDRFRTSDLVARFGGEEFVVILEDATRDDAIRIADEVRTMLAARPVLSDAGERLVVTVSGGCAQLSDAEATREQLLRTADVALFMAKRAGRDRVVAA